MPRRPRGSRLGGSRGVPVLVPVRASPVPSVLCVRVSDCGHDKIFFAALDSFAFLADIRRGGAGSGSAGEERGGGAAAGGEGRGGARPQEADGGACDAQAAEGGSGGGTEGSSLDPLEPALPESGDGTIAAAGGEEEVEGGRKAPRRRRGRRGRGARGRGGGLEKGPDTAAGLAAERPNPVEEVSTGGAAPAEGEEGGRSCQRRDRPIEGCTRATVPRTSEHWNE